jgi:uncharacterized membrane protein
MTSSDIRGLAAYWITVVVVLIIALALPSGVLQVIAVGGIVGAAISTYLTWRGSRNRGDVS